MSVELNTVVQEVVVDDSKSAQGAARVIDAMDEMAAASDRATAATGRQASGFAALDAALKASTPAQESALRRLDQWRAQADPVESALQRLSRAETDLNRAITQGISTEQEKARILDQLWTKLLGAAEAQEKLNAAMKAQSAQTAFNTQLGVRDDFGTAARAADIAAYGQELDRLQQKYAPLAAAQSLYERQIEEIAQAQKVGALTAEQAATALAVNKAGYEKTAAAIQASQAAVVGHTGAMKLQSWQVANLGQQLQDVFVQLQGGTNPFTILAQQGPQITTAMGGVKNAIALVVEQITPFRVGLAATAAAVVLLLSRAADLEGEARAFSVSLRANGKDAELTTQQLHTLVEGMRDLGAASAEARKAVDAAISVPGATADAITNALRDAPDYAAAYKTSLDEAAKSLTELGTTGYSAIKKLDDAHHFLTADEATLIRQLSEHGDKASAVAVAYAALERQIAGAARNAMSPMAVATNELTRSWSDLVGTIANTSPVLAAVESISGAFKTLAGLLGGDLKSAYDGWAQHVANDPTFAILKGAANLWLKVGEWTSGVKSPDAAGSTPSTSGAGAIGGRSFYAASNDTSAVSASAIDAETAAYQRQVQVLSASANVRSILQARLEAENKAMLEGKNAADIKTAGDRAATLATMQLSSAANDNLKAIKAQTEGTLAIAAAGGTTTEAGLRAQAEMQARIAKLQNVTVNERALTDELLRQAEVSAHLQAVDDLRSAQMDTEIARMKAAAAQIADPVAAHQQELAIERQEEINRLTLQYRGNVDDVNRAMAEFDKKQAYDDQARYWNDVKAKAEGVANDISTYLVDGVTNAGEQGFKGFWATAMAGVKRFVASLAGEFLKTQFIMPVVMSVVGSSGISSLLGVVPAGGNGSGGVAGGLNGLSSLSSLSNLGGLLSWNSTIGNSFVTGSIGQWLGLSTPAAGGVGPVAVSGLGQGIASIGNLLGSAGVGYGIGNIWSGLGLGKSTGSSIGGALGGAIGSVIPGVGTILGSIAGSALGGLFGNDQPSDKFAETNVDISQGTLGSPIYNPSEADQTNISASKALAQQFLTIEQQIMALTGGTGPAAAFAKVGSRDGLVVGVGQTGIGVNTRSLGMTAEFANTEEGAQKALDFMVQSLAKQITGVQNADIQKVLQHGGTAQEILDNLTLVNTLITATADAVDPLTAALKAVNDNFDDLDKKARDLGLSTDLLTKLEAQRQKQLDEINAGYSLTGYSNVAGALGQLSDWMNAQQLSDVSSLNPIARQQLAMQNFQNLYSAVHDNGDLGQVGALTNSATTLLNIARQNYGSAAGFTSVEAQVNQMLTSLGLSISSQQSIGDQVTKALQAATQTNVQKLDEVRDEIARMRSDFQLLADKLSAA